MKISELIRILQNEKERHGDNIVIVETSYRDDAAEHYVNMKSQSLDIYTSVGCGLIISGDILNEH